MFTLRFLTVPTIAMLGFGSTSHAAPPLNAGSLGSATKGHTSNSNSTLTTALNNLQAIKAILDNADHDYGGHRGAAVKDIVAAEHQLKQANKGSHTGGKKASGSSGNSGKMAAGKGSTAPSAGSSKKTSGNQLSEPQALSDAQLAQCITKLQSTISLIKNSPSKSGGAISELNSAIVQLQEALAFSKAKRGS
ncbi:hypothetical protein KIH39_06440 [Telmatocola sphagniphila]|uniref:Secreted protein n=1 Tax=Telmatocola sphagniphila TaxID=1123043 RepID=A0A8E6BAR9_9BACT|nr:hypothetical protein [Telmatocola sphagniphila]QVL33545.1 hypothetical protein KIH39_06440 [Telmatocola sphagniphila]